MDGSVVFAAAYGSAMGAVALGIDRAGVVAARRRPGSEGRDAIAPWPHTGSIALHTTVAAVACAAAVLLAAVFAVLHHSLADLALLALPMLIGGATLIRLATQLRATPPGSPDRGRRS